MKRKPAEVKYFGLTPTIIFLPLQNSCCPRGRTFKTIDVFTTVFFSFCILQSFLLSLLSQATSLYCTPFSLPYLSICLQRRQSIAPPEGDLSAFFFSLVQKKKTIIVPLSYLAAWRNEIDTYFGIITALFINLVQKVLLMLPAHRHTTVGNTY